LRNIVTFIRLIHFLAIFWMIAGIGNTIIPIYGAWAQDNLKLRSITLSASSKNYSYWLLPGVISSGITGYLYAGVDGLNVITSGWLLITGLIWIIQIFILLPLFGIGLRRVHYLALQAEKRGTTTQELDDALADNAPLVFGTLIIISTLLITIIPIFKPFS